VDISAASDVYGVEFDLVYNPDILRYVDGSAQVGELSSGAFIFTALKSDRVRVGVAKAGGDSVDGDGTVVTNIEFEVLQYTSSSLELENTKFQISLVKKH